MTKAEAVKSIVSDARSERVSNASVKRTVKALDALGLDAAEVISVLRYLDICRDDGTPYGNIIKRIW